MILLLLQKNHCQKNVGPSFILFPFNIYKKKLALIQTKAFWWLLFSEFVIWILNIKAMTFDLIVTVGLWHVYSLPGPCSVITVHWQPQCWVEPGLGPALGREGGRLHLGPLLTSHLHPDRAGPTGQFRPIRL